MKTKNKEGMLELVKSFTGEICYINPEDFPDFSEGLDEKIQETAYKIGKSETGAILLSGEKSYIIIPPFPIVKTFEDGLNLLHLQMERKFTLGVILLRLGEYSLGVFEGKNLVTHKTGTQFVSGQTRAGGQSAARYSRIREGQINDFFKSVCSQVREKFGPYQSKIDYVFFGGDSQTVKKFCGFCNYLDKFCVMERVLNIRHMKLDSLRKSLEEVWKFRVYEI